ncbi:hypothetical protein [Spongiimicrobium salis]|uniref:hypothetical protein n=1 Tax=Spongiimicrobium salis TaxID=1667022 RepID=UPI00374D84A6
MKKKIGYTLLTIILIAVIICAVGIRKFNKALFQEKTNYFNYTYQSKSIHFNWAGDSIGGIYESQAAITIPLKIENLSHQFYLQFDTGAPHTLLYEKDVKALRALGLDIQEIVQEDGRYIKNLDFSLSNNHIRASMIKILPNYGNTFDKSDTIAPIKIGTIGSDFLANRITSIDFKNQKLQVYDERPLWMKALSGFKTFDFTGRRIMLPVTLDNKAYQFLYDSGCSAFGLITIKSRFKRYTDTNRPEIRYGANSWGNSIPIVSKASNKLFTVGNANLALKRVSYVDMYTATQPLITPFTRIGGWLGNQPFNESMLILDTLTEEFTVLEK